MNARPKQKLSRFLRRRLINIGVPYGPAAAVATQFQSSLDTMGPLGVVDYYKRVGDTLLWYLYASSDKPAWVKTRGRFPVALEALKGLPETVLLRVAKLARAIRLETIVWRQVDKVVGGVIRPSQAQPTAEDTVSRLIERGVRYYGLQNRQPDVLLRPPSVGKYFSRTISTSTDKVRHTKEPPLWESIEILRAVPQLRMVPDWQETLYPLHPNQIQRFVVERATDSGHPAGEIHAAQEGGAKLRMFASPYIVVQCLLRPIHHWIADNFLSGLETNCTWDQLKGAEFAQRALQQGKTVHSVDLSTATCRFPFWPQIGMLKFLGLDDARLAALEWACKAEWNLGAELVQPFKRTKLRWEVGQPLGLAPSMSMFSLAHNMLLAGICREYGLEPEEVFRVLGDDVVIVSDSVHAKYLAVMEEAGVPISWNKSHTSSSYAEFAGASITRTSIVRPGQWRQVREASAVSLACELGTPLYGEVTALMEKVQKLYLFREGLFDPPPEEWMVYIRLSTLINLDRLQAWLVSESPLWYYKIMKVWEKQIPLMESVGRPVGFVDDPPNVRKTIFHPLKGFLDDDVVAEYHMACIHHNSRYMLVAINAYKAIASLYERLLVSESEAADLITAVSDQVRSLVYEPPTGRNVNLNRLVQQFRRLLSSLPEEVTLQRGDLGRRSL